MKDQKLTKVQLLSEIAVLRQKLENLEKSQIGEKPFANIKNASDEKFRILAEKANDAIIIMCEDKRLYYNPKYLELAGYHEPAEIADKPPLSLVHPDDREMVAEYARRRIKDGSAPQKYEFRVIRADGSIIWIEISSSLIDYEGKPAALGYMRDITDRKLMEEKLHAEEQRFRALAEQSSDIILLINRKGIILYENSAVERVLGLKKEERIGKNVLENLHPDDSNIVTNAFNKLIGDINAPAQKDEIRIRHSDGSWREVEVVASNLTQNNVVEMIIINLRDITERKEAEKALRISEERYRLLADHMKDQLWLMDLKMNLTYVSPSVERITGYSSDEIKKIPLDKLLTPKSFKKALEFISVKMPKAIKESSKDLVFRTLELEFILKGGQTVWGECSFSFIRDDKGKVVSILGEARDITNRKQAEEALRISEERYRLLADNITEHVWLMDIASMKTVYVSPSVEKMYGYTLDEMKNISLRELVTEESFQKMVDAFLIEKAKALATPPPSIHKYSLELEARHKDGRLLWVDNTLSFIRDENGKPAFILGETRDITDRKRAEEALRKSEQKYLELSIIDDLTQLYNSRHFYAQLEKEIERSNRYEQPLTLLLLDLDKFKDFNDTYGHVEGDDVLSRLGQVIKRCLRETDSAYRYGGEEFTIMLPMTTSEEGIVTAKRIQTELRKEAFSPVLGQEVYMTVSIGLAQYKPKEEMKAFVQRVDQLMYQAKKNGRDRICPES